MEEDKSIGEKIADFRRENNITQEELAEHLFVTRQAVSSWERNITTPDYSTLERICGRLGVKLDDFICNNHSGDPQKNKKTNRIVLSEKENIAMKKTSKYTVAIGLFYAAALFLGIGLFLTLGLIYNTPNMWGASFFMGGGLFLFLGLTAHGIITLVSKSE